MSINKAGLLAVCLFGLASVAWAVHIDDWSLGTMWPATLAIIGPGGWFAYQRGRERGGSSDADDQA